MRFVVAACGASGVVCGACEAGASDAGGVVVGGVSDGVGGVCDEAAPVKQSATSAELLRRSKRLVEIDMTPPIVPTGNDPVRPNIDASRRIDAVRGVGAAVARARACRHQIDVRQWEVRAPQRARVGVRRSRTRAAVSVGKRPEDIRQRQGRRLGKDQRAGEMDQGTDRAAVVGAIVSACRDRRARTCASLDASAAGDREFICRVNSAARSDQDAHARTSGELERERKQRQARTPSRP